MRLIDTVYKLYLAQRGRHGAVHRDELEDVGWVSAGGGRGDGRRDVGVSTESAEGAGERGGSQETASAGGL